ncbi:Cc8L18.2-like protein, partial [Daphnia magna]
TTDKQHANEDVDFDAFEGIPVIYLAGTSSVPNNKPLSFKRILCHWAAFTMQKKSHLTYLLELLKEHRPQIDFDTLPSSGKQLMLIDGRDMPQPYTTTLQLAR